MDEVWGFNSLQTGKAFRTNVAQTSVTIDDVFQFPSNGKGFPNLLAERPRNIFFLFQFPSNGKGFPNGRGKEELMLLSLIVSIPFKRERLSELPQYLLDEGHDLVFQFPSNGKGFPNFQLP